MLQCGYSSLLLFGIILSAVLYTTQQKIGLLEADKTFITPKIYEKNIRVQRDIPGKNDSKHIAAKFIEIGDWLVKLDSEDYLLLAPKFVVEWVNVNNSKRVEKFQGCTFHIGSVHGIELSQAVVTLCKSLVTAFFSVGLDSFFVEPVEEISRKHVLYTSPFNYTRVKRSQHPFYSSEEKYWTYNLTGDVLGVGNEAEPLAKPFSEKNSTGEIRSVQVDGNDCDVNPSSGGYRSDENPFYPENRQEHREQIDDSDEGYFYDTAWSTNVILSRKTGSSISPSKWLEIAIAVDHTLISFHGRGKVAGYVLSLMNIVNAIYQDPSLHGNIKLVIARLILYEHKKHGVIKAGNAKRSLENVNYWNRRLHASLSPEDPKHDLAIWLTRSDIGGPSGYAPVAGVCDPKRSCALNRDEGLTSAFIIAHETAHILGLSHDGDIKNGNDCREEALDWSIMAPMVSATFNKFSWSECSKNEFKKLRDKWTCLLNDPDESVEIVLNATLRTSFTMDEQCRMEFGNGYSMCTAFEIIDPCSHLWCGHKTSPLVCKTKKGPPLEGTECGFGKWCVNGYCAEVDNKTVERVPIVLNPQNGGWSNWTAWGSCSKPCGIGAQFRSRKCNNPEPSYGGNHCEGDAEEWQICKNRPCETPVIDLRAEQCKYLPKILSASERMEGGFTWLPYESDYMEKKCKLSCINAEQKKLYMTNENLRDGTLCSYEDIDNICVQGKCYEIGCDGVLESGLKRDRCGVCGGNNTLCSEINLSSHKTLKREISRVSVLPNHAWQIKIKINVTTIGNSSSVIFILKNRKNNKYIMTIPSNSVHKRIFEGTNFHYTRTNNQYEFWTKGPLLSETVLMVVLSKRDVGRGLKVTANTLYSIDKSYIVPSKRYSWILGGWGPCSASCGGGRRKKTAACWDNKLNKVVRRNYCDLSQKPILPTEKCNTYDCDFHWIAGNWEPCSATCGDKGMQNREIYCVPSSILNKILCENNGTIISNIWNFMVSPKKCSGMKPNSVRPCNRNQCIHHWISGKWSQCSVSCGMGIQTRKIYCPITEVNQFSRCSQSLPIQQRHCNGNNSSRDVACRPRKQQCHDDISKFCSLDLFEKYCTLRNFKRLCCASCKTFHATLSRNVFTVKANLLQLT